MVRGNRAGRHDVVSNGTEALVLGTDCAMHSKGCLMRIDDRTPDDCP
jgi:hypothetical protein